MNYLMKEKLYHRLRPVLAALLVAFFAAFSGWAMAGASSWYHELLKPHFQMPLFWFALSGSLLMLSLALVWVYVLRFRQKGKAQQKISGMLMLQGALHVLWSITFFQMRWLALGVVLLLGAVVVIVPLIKAAGEIHPPLTYWLLPYGIWLLYALILNYTLFMLN